MLGGQVEDVFPLCLGVDVVAVNPETAEFEPLFRRYFLLWRSFGLTKERKKEIFYNLRVFDILQTDFLQQYCNFKA